MRYVDLIQKDGPLSIWPLDENLFSATGDVVAKSITSYGSDTSYNGTYKYNSTIQVENKGMPLVLGGMAASYLKDNGSSPSLILPRGNAFTQKSIVLPSTLEFWLAIDKSTDQYVKVLGVNDAPDFGVYIYKNYIVFKADNKNFTALPVDNWAYQKHIAISYSSNSFTLYVNGESSGFYVLGKPLEDLGLSSGSFYFYGSDELGFTAIDAPAIYLQDYSSVIAKRHFAYGLAYRVPSKLFSTYGGSYQQFEYSQEPALNILNIPSTASINNMRYENITVDKSGLQLENNLTVEYNHPNSAITQTEFYFNNTDANYLNINRFGRALSGSGLVGLKLEFSQSASAEETVLEITDNLKTLQLIYSGSNLVARQYSSLLANNTIKYNEVSIIPSASINTTYRILIGIVDGLCYINVDGSVKDTSSFDRVNSFSDNTRCVVGAKLVNVNFDKPYQGQFSSGKIYFVNILKNENELIKITDTLVGTYNNNFDQYYKTGCIYFNNYIRLKKKGFATFKVPLESFAKNIFLTSNKKRINQLLIKHNYPEVINGEVSVNVQLSNGESFFSYNNLLPYSVIDNVSDLDDVSNYLLIVDINIDSQDAIYFSPILKNISIESRGYEKDGDGQLYTRFSGFDKTVELYSSDGLSFVSERVYSPLLLGKYSGINVNGAGVSGVFNSIAANTLTTSNNGLQTISFFARTDSNSDEKIISWIPASGTVAPTSLNLYLDGVLEETINFGSNQYLTKSQLLLEKYVWRHVTIVFSSPLIVIKRIDAPYIGPTITFGDSAGGSECLIQHLATYQTSISSALINQTYKSFVGNNIISGTLGNVLSISEPADATKIIKYNWITA